MVLIMKKLPVLFYIFIGILTVALIVTLSLWIHLKNSVFLYVTLAELVFYIGVITTYLIRGTLEEQINETLKCDFLMLLQNYETKLVYIAYVGNERRLKHPSRYRRDYLVEFYPEKTNIDLLKQHLWFDLPEEGENLLRSQMIGGMDIPYPLLADIKQKKVLLQTLVYEEIKSSTHFERLLQQNEIIPYGEQND